MDAAATTASTAVINAGADQAGNSQASASSSLTATGALALIGLIPAALLLHGLAGGVPGRSG